MQKGRPGIRLGAIVPGLNIIAEPEMYKMAPEGVTVHFERSPALEPSLITNAVQKEHGMPTLIKAFEEAGDDLTRAARWLAQVEPKVISYVETSGSYFRGIAYDKELISKMEAGGGIRAITTSTAAVEALKELGIKKLCFITPYGDFLTGKGKEFFGENGFEVLVAKHLSVLPSERYKLPTKAHLDLAYELATSSYTPGCDGIFCSCTGFRVTDIIEKVEKKIGKPMLSANQVTMWSMLKIAGVRKPVAGFGELMRHL